MADGAGGGWQSEVAFLRRTLIVVCVAALILFAWAVRHTLLLAFGAVLVAVLVRAVADAVKRWLRLSGGWLVLVACLLIAAPLALGFTLIGSEIRTQAIELVQRVPDAADMLERVFGVQIPIPGEADPEPTNASAVGNIAWQAASYALVALDAVAALVIVVVGGVYLAANPGLYRRGIVLLLPQRQQARAEEALAATGKALQLWIQARLITMAAVGVMTGLGAWAIGLPAPLALGIFAGLADIVPLIGPFIGAVPGVLLAINEGWEMVLWTAGLYFIVQQIEGYVLTPLLGERMVRIPPALLLFSVVAAGSAFGLGGVLLAGPLTVVAYVLVSKLYVRETLGEPVGVPGEDKP
ncbi:MAG TPA: AI-2E family transporter [Falsiroseomonas sp.]|jgi:predicted PurR-regulated permease PerM|nr:AI-2E family transporter [Falsiroseomonas sp.]